MKQLEIDKILLKGIFIMNKTKRNLIIASAIVNFITISASLIMSVLLKIYGESFLKFAADYLFLISFSQNIYYAVFSFAAGLVGSIFLLFSVREKGKHFRRTQGLFIAGFVIIIFCGGFLSWLLLFISLFVADVIVMNTKSEIRKEQKVEETEIKQKEQMYEEKKKKIEDLKRLRDNGLISENEYKQKLFELL